MAEKMSGLSKGRLHVLHANQDLSPEETGMRDYILLDNDDWSDGFREYEMALKAEKPHVKELVFSEAAGISAPDVILNYAKIHDIDLIVLGTHGRRGVQRLLLGSTAEEVVRLAKCPVLTVGGKAFRTSGTLIKTVLAPIDFSDFSLEALNDAKELAAAFSARLELLHVIQDVVVPAPYVVSFESTASPEVRENAEKALNELASAISKVPVGTHIDRGLPADKITVFAREHDVDLIVMASRGLTGFDRFIQGSVSQEVLRLAPCPVLTARHTPA